VNVEPIDSQSFFRDAPTAFDDAAICVRRNKAAKMLALSVSTLDRLVKAGDIPRFKTPNGVFFRVNTLREWARCRERQAAQETLIPDSSPSGAMSTDTAMSTHLAASTTLPTRQ